MGNSSRIIAHYDPCGSKDNSNNVFYFRDCSDIEINRLFLDTDNPIGATGDVVGINFDDNTIDVKIYDKFPVTGYEHFCALNSFDEKGTLDYILTTYNNILKTREVTLPDNTKRERFIGFDYDVWENKRCVKNTKTRFLQRKISCCSEIFVPIMDNLVKQVFSAIIHCNKPEETVLRHIFFFLILRKRH